MHFRTPFGIWSQISLEGIKVSTSGKRRYHQQLIPSLMQKIWWTLVY